MSEHIFHQTLPYLHKTFVRQLFRADGMFKLGFLREHDLRLGTHCAAKRRTAAAGLSERAKIQSSDARVGSRGRQVTAEKQTAGASELGEGGRCRLDRSRQLKPST